MYRFYYIVVKFHFPIERSLISVSVSRLTGRFSIHKSAEPLITRATEPIDVTDQ